MSYQNEWLLFEAEDEFDEIKHREPTEELLFYRAVASVRSGRRRFSLQRVLPGLPAGRFVSLW